MDSRAHLDRETCQSDRPVLLVEYPQGATLLEAGCWVGYHVDWGFEVHWSSAAGIGSIAQEV